MSVAEEQSTREKIIDKSGNAVKKVGQASKVAGTTTSAVGKTARVAGNAGKYGGKAINYAGKGVSSAGKGIMQAGKGLSSSGYGAILGVPLAAAGAAVTAAGKTAEVAGKAAEKTGEAVDKSGKAVDNTGKKMREFGKNAEQKSSQIKDLNSAFTDKYKLSQKKKKIILIGICIWLAICTVFIIVLISPLMSLGIIDISGMGGSSGLGYSTNTYLQKVNDECKSIIVDNQAYSLEDYVKGVVSAEAYTDEGMEALKAQAIAARTFAIKRTNNCTISIENSDVTQKFTSNFVDSAVEATVATEGLVLTDNSELIMAQYDSFYTDGDYACDDDGCSVTYTKLPNNETHKVTVSNDYKSYIAGGHGRGMSQVASYQLAKEGYKFDYILKYFYSPSVQISSLRGYGGYTSGLSAGADGFSKRTGAPSDKDTHDIEFYYSDNNVSYRSNTDLVGQCTWYAVGRANEILSAANSDLRLERAPHAKNWYQDNIEQGTSAFSYSPNVEEPKVGAIIVWSSNEFGHVAVVEAVNSDGTIDYSEANINSARSSTNPYGFRYQSNVSYTESGEGTISNIWKGYSFVGYIYVIE
mgnify:FL=1